MRWIDQLTNKDDSNSYQQSLGVIFLWWWYCTHSKLIHTPCISLCFLWVSVAFIFIFINQCLCPQCQNKIKKTGIGIGGYWGTHLFTLQGFSSYYRVAEVRHSYKFEVCQIYLSSQTQEVQRSVYNMFAALIFIIFIKKKAKKLLTYWLSTKLTNSFTFFKQEEGG